MIRVLWFSNTPAAGDEYVSSNGTGGWLKSLDKAIQNKVELHVAFYDKRLFGIYGVPCKDEYFGQSVRRDGDIMSLRLNASKLFRTLGYQPSKTIEDIFKR